jgi:HEAT repeat protein
LRAFTEPVCYKRNMAVDALLQALGDWDRDLRLAAADALGRIADKRAIEPLVRTLADTDEWVRLGAVQALKALGWQPAAVADAA